jgi:hypothetical protein
MHNILVIKSLLVELEMIRVCVLNNTIYYTLFLMLIFFFALSFNSLLSMRLEEKSNIIKIEV